MEIGGDPEKVEPQQFSKRVSNNLIMSCRNYRKDIPPIYVIQDETRMTLSMLDHKILAYPSNEMILECSLDHLVQQIW